MNGFETILPFLKPIEHLILDDSVSEVMVNGPDRIFVERNGFVERAAGVTLSERALTVAVKNIARRLGDDISEAKPILDSRLPDGSRVAAVVPSLQPRRRHTNHSQVQCLPLRTRRSNPRWNARPSTRQSPRGLRASKAKYFIAKTNPRSQFDAAALAELADNIRLHGVLQPVLVRPLPGGEPDWYELVAGARRYRASRLAKRETIPATIRELTDTQCLELQLIENLQRADVHELDEARGYAALMNLEPETYTVETIAEKIGRSEKYVYARLRLMHLVEEAQQAFYTGKLSVAHAFEIARLQPEDQKRALQECFPGHRSASAILKDRKAEAVTVRQLREWIEREIHLDITHAPFRPAGRNPTAGGWQLR